MHDLTQTVADGMQTYPGDPPVRVSQATDFDTDGYRATDIRMRSHTGTHVDAPAHTESAGKSLDEFPIERFTCEALRVDCREFDARDPIPPACVPDADVDCVVFWTGWDEYWGSERYLDHPYLTPEAARLCADRGYDIGLDTINPDPTPSAQASSDEPEGLQAHHALLGDGRLVVENLTNLGTLPRRFELRVSPLALAGDGAPVRAVAVSE